MKSNNKLNTALKDALYEHHEPLREAQWERLRAELEEKKKRRFLPWFFVGAGLLLLSGAFSYYLISKPSVQTAISDTTTQTNSHASATSKATPQVDPGAELLAKTEPSMDNDFNAVKGTKGFEPYKTQTSSGRKILKDGAFKSSAGKDLPENTEPMKWGSVDHQIQLADINDGLKKAVEKLQMSVSDNENPIENQSAKVGKTEENKPETVQSDNSTASLNNKDTTVKKTNKDDDSTKKPEKVRFIIGGSAGIAGVRSEVKGLSNEERLHKDSKNVFKMSNENQSAMFVNLNFEFKLSQRVGLRFNTGLHHKRINNQVNFTYKLREIPIRLPDNTILSYITVPDTSNPLVINVRESQSYSFLSLPLLVNYSLPINKNSELLMGAGVNLSALVASTGSSFSLNELSYKQAGDMIQNPLSFGLNGSLGYSRRLYGKWWLSAEAGMQSMNLRYDLGSGELRSKMVSQSLALNLRYKITK
jgi:hypothetical protein